MGKVVYLMNVSLDGFVETADHSIEWTTPSEELLYWFNDQARKASVFVWGRRVYELMAAYWPTAESNPDASPAELEWARLINPMPKVVFSTTLKTEIVEWNARLTDGDVGEELSRLRTDYPGEIQIGGPTFAAEAIRRGLVDVFRVVVHPVVIGGGLPFFPPGVELRLRLVETRSFESGFVYLGYERV